MSGQNHGINSIKYTENGLQGYVGCVGNYRHDLNDFIFTLMVTC